MQNYAEVFEGYLIPAEEGFGDVLKTVGGAVARGFKAALAFIRKILGAIGQKIREIFSNKKKESPKEAKERLEIEKIELEKKIKYLEDAVNAGKFRNDQLEKRFERESTKHDRATQMIAQLKNQLELKQAKIDAVIRDAREDREIAAFEQTLYQFTTLVSGQIAKAYSELPKIISKVNEAGYTKIDNNGTVLYEDIDYEIRDKIPTMDSGSWRRLYTDLAGSLQKVAQSPTKYLVMNSILGRACELVVSQGNKCIDYLDQVYRSLDSKNNDRIGWVINQISATDGFIDMLSHSVSLMNTIIDLYANHGIGIRHNVNDTL